MSHEDFPTEDPAVVTCGLPYANGDLHIGHLRTYVGGDIYSRALKRLGQQTAFVSGSDMHGTPVAVNAAEEGVTPEEFALRHHEQYEATFPKFDVEFDNYGHTHDATNVETTREIVSTLEAEGYVYEKEIPVAYDPDADQWLPDRFVEGACPYCGEHARGDECDEGCGRHLEPGEIEDPVSTITGNPAEYRNREHKFFAVSDLQEYLGEFIDRLEGTSNAQNQPREWIEGELQDWCITRDMDWGVDYPGDDDLVLYVWVDAPIEYISSTKQYTERVGPGVFDWEEAWRGTGVDEDGVPIDGGEIVHIIGRDIIQHHTVFWPAMLRGAGYVEPRAVMASGFITLEGKGFSTSRDRAVWADEYLEEGFRPDLLRYYLATNGGFQQDVDFSWGRFRERVNNELVGTVGNFVYRSLLFAAREFGGAPDADLSDDVRERIEAEDVDLDSAWEHVAEGQPSTTLGPIGKYLGGLGDGAEQYREEHADAFVDRLEERLVDVDLSTPHDRRVREAFRELANGDWEAAADVLATEYETVCETVQPVLQPDADHPAACHLYDQPPAEDRASTDASDGVGSIDAADAESANSD